MTKPQTLIHARTNQILAQKIRHADGYFSRLKGLIGSAPLEEKEAILISPCKQIHTHFMRYSIDVVYLDKNLNVISKISAMKPWKMTGYFKHAYYVLELQANAADLLAPNDLLILK